MCKFCEGETKLVAKVDNSNECVIIENMLVIKVVANVYDKFNNNVIDYAEAEDYFKIQYCPLCGDKL